DTFGQKNPKLKKQKIQKVNIILTCCFCNGLNFSKYLNIPSFKDRPNIPITNRFYL
ncbi:hypothetical protein AAKU52_003359, partial [Pedobacter sp. CG_S7]